MSLGAWLRKQRTQLHLTQEALAERLGTTSQTIRNWERDQTLPQAHYRLQICHLFGIPPEKLFEEIEAFQQQGESGTTPLWQVPYLRNPYFTGREEVLHRLHNSLAAQPSSALQPRAISGLGGIGKTQTMLEYAYRYASEYKAIFWINAESSMALHMNFARIARLLALPMDYEQDPIQIIDSVKRWLMTHEKWLLLIDGVEGFDLLADTLPTHGNGHVILTTRLHATGTMAQGIDLECMEPEEGALLLLRRAKLLTLNASISEAPEELRLTARKLSLLLGGLPLALDQAGAYIEETGCELTTFVQRYRRRPQLLDWRGTAGADHPSSVMATFRLAYDQVQRHHPAAADLLCVCTFLSPDAIPEELFMAGAAHLGSRLEPVAADPSQLDQAIATLRNLSLVQRHAEARMFSIHCLVQTVLRERMSELECVMWQRQAIKALHATFPHAANKDWRQCERLLPHVLACASSTSNWMEDRELKSLLWKAAEYLRERAHGGQTGSLYQETTHLWEAALRSGRSHFAFLFSRLGDLYRNQGQNRLAEALYRLGLIHPEADEGE